MKMRLGDTIIELGNIAYAQKKNDWIVYIYFVGTSENQFKPLKVNCGEDQIGSAVYSGSADDLLDDIVANT